MKLIQKRSETEEVVKVQMLRNNNLIYRRNNFTSTDFSVQEILIPIDIIYH